MSGDPYRLAFPVFVVAMLTDLIDGALARALNATGELGRWLDPISDKVLTNVAWLSLWGADWVTGWIALPLILRDVGIGFVYIAARNTGRRFEVNHSGRVAVSAEAVSLALLLFHGPWLNIHWEQVGTVVGIVALALSLVAVVDYVRQGPDAPR